MRVDPEQGTHRSAGASNSNTDGSPAPTTPDQFPGKPTTTNAPGPTYNYYGKFNYLPENPPTSDSPSRAERYLSIIIQAAIAFFTGLLAFFAYRAATIAWDTLKEMREQNRAQGQLLKEALELTQQTAKATTETADASMRETDFLLKTERPYLVNTTINFIGSENPTSLQLRDKWTSTLTGSPVVGISFNNAGRTPALNVTMACGFRIAAELPDQRPKLDETEVIAGPVIGPLNTEQIRVTCKFTISDTQQQSLGQGSESFFVYGWVRYTDPAHLDAQPFEAGFGWTFNLATQHWECVGQRRYNYEK